METNDGTEYKVGGDVNKKSMYCFTVWIQGTVKPAISGPCGVKCLSNRCQHLVHKSSGDT